MKVTNFKTGKTKKWFKNSMTTKGNTGSYPITIHEDHLQKELRKLHAMIEELE